MGDIGRKPEIHPRPTLGRRLDAVARAMFPSCCTAVLMLATAAPFGLADQAALLPAVSLGCVWFWSLFRPFSMPPAAAFLLGVLFDLLGYLPLGVGVLTLLAVHGVAMRWRRLLTRQGFLIVWLAFAAVAAGASFLSWGLASLLSFRLLPIQTALFQCALSAALYPVIAILFTRAHRGAAAPERA